MVDYSVMGEFEIIAHKVEGYSSFMTWYGFRNKRTGERHGWFLRKRDALSELKRFVRNEIRRYGEVL